MKKNILGISGIVFGVVGFGAILMSRLQPMNFLSIIAVILGGIELNKDSKNPIAIIAIVLGVLGLIWGVF